MLKGWITWPLSYKCWVSEVNLCEVGKYSGSGRSVCREVRESSPDMFDMRLWVLKQHFSGHQLQLHTRLHPLYSTVHEDLVIPLPPVQISYYRFSLLTGKHSFHWYCLCSLKLFTAVIAKAYRVNTGVCSTKMMVLHHQYDDSAAY